MKTLRKPRAGEIKSWAFIGSDDRAIRLRLNLKDSKCVRKTLDVYKPVWANIMFHKKSESWYVASLDGKQRDYELTKILNDISTSLAVGMNRTEWESALPDIFGKRTQYSIADAMEEYYKVREFGSARMKRGNISTMRGLKGAKTSWKNYGKDIELFRFQKAVAGNGSEDRDLKELLWGYIDYLRARGCSVATQGTYLGYIKDTLRYVAEIHLLALPELAKISAGKPETMPIVITNEETLKALAALDPDNYEKQWQQEAAIIAKMQFVFGYRIGDAVKVTRNHFQVTDNGVYIKMNSEKSRTPTIHLVPDKFWETLLKYMEKWGGRVVVTQNAGTLPRLRLGIKAIVKDLPGMDEMVEVLRQKPDKSIEMVWVPIHEEFTPHMLRATSGTQRHLRTGNGPEHLGNTPAIFFRHYKGTGIDIAKEKEFHQGLGLL